MLQRLLSLVIVIVTDRVDVWLLVSFVVDSSFFQNPNTRFFCVDVKANYKNKRLNKNNDYVKGYFILPFKYLR